LRTVDPDTGKVEPVLVVCRDVIKSDRALEFLRETVIAETGSRRNVRVSVSGVHPDTAG
jgi:hypothetical protein